MRWQQDMKCYRILQNKGGCDQQAALEAAEAAVRCMEDCPLFNAGKGSVFANDEQIRCDASIMTCSFDNATTPGKDEHADAAKDEASNEDNESIRSCHQVIRKRRFEKTPIPRAGAIAGVSNIQNPISLAKAVMERTPHVMLIGKGAVDFAKQLPNEARVEFQPDDYFWTERRWTQLVNIRQSEDEEQLNQTEQVLKVQLDHSSNPKHDFKEDLCDKKFGTVGCVALYRPDANENVYQLASATSTGGMTNQRYHRVGDSPIIGAGTYANHLCAISCTGHGEWFIRCVAAHDIAKRLEYRHGYESTSCATDNTLLKRAVDEVILGTLMSESDDGKQEGDGGAIALDKDGNFAAEMNCPGMFRGVNFIFVPFLHFLHQCTQALRQNPSVG